MLIESARIEGVGPFRSALCLGPLDPGLNILAQPNEWGKSTVVRALSRTLFDRYRSESEDIRQMRPAGTSLSPRVELVFQARGDRYRLIKGFLDRKGCELFRWGSSGWECVDESDKADQRLRALLGAPALEGRVAKPETWGFLRYLWARQDDAPEWPDWSGGSGDSARRRLATVEIDPVVRAISGALKAHAEVVFTPTGKVRSGSPLDLAIDECTRIRRELDEIRTRRRSLEELEQHCARLSGELPILQRERVAKHEEAARIRAEAEASEKLQGVITNLEAAFATTDAQLLQLRKDQETLAGIAEAERIATSERERLAGTWEDLCTQIPRSEQLLIKAEDELQSAKKGRVAREKQMERQRRLIQLRLDSDELERHSRHKDRVSASLMLVRELEARLASTTALPKKTLKQLREWERQNRDARVRLECTGLQLTVTPLSSHRTTGNSDGTESAIELEANQPRTIHAAQSISLKLPGWGEVAIRSGAEEPASLRDAIAERQHSIDSVLSQIAATSISAAETAAEQAQDLEQQLRNARQTLAAHLQDWKSPEELESAISRTERSSRQLRSAIDPSEEEQGFPLVALQTDLQARTASLASAIAAEESAAAMVAQVRAELEKLRSRREEHAAERAGLDARIRGLSEQRDLLHRRYQEGLAAEVQTTQGEWVRAEARLLEARRQMPPNADRLPERSQRAGRAAAETDATCHTTEIELQRLQAQIQVRGGEGLYSRESELDERLVWLEAEARRLADEGLAARLLTDVIQQHEASATRKVLGPLEERLSGVFAGLTGISGRRVWFDEMLQVRGTGFREDELVRFDDLSRGAREQLLLALRAAIALELAVDGPQCLILDDVLVNTDAVRQENVLDYLLQLSTRVQIILLTCHADRYRGVGTLVPVSMDQ